MLWQVVTDFIPGRLRSNKLVTTAGAVYIAIDSTQGNVEHVYVRFVVDQNCRAAGFTKQTVGIFRF
jgi:hypothetical protein